MASCGVVACHFGVQRHRGRELVVGGGEQRGRVPLSGARGRVEGLNAERVPRRRRRKKRGSAHLWARGCARGLSQEARTRASQRTAARLKIGLPDHGEPRARVQQNLCPNSPPFSLGSKTRPPLAASVGACEIKSDAFCCTPAPGLNLQSSSKFLCLLDLFLQHSCRFRYLLYW